MTGLKKGKTKIPSSVWILGFVSMLMDISSELIHSLLPLFMITTLGASAFAIGLIEGVAESTALITRIFSGVLSDYLRKRKGLIVLGYALGALSKPFFAIATSIGMIFTARFVDRIGKGIRGAPRDALVADLAPQELRGAAFGLRQSLDTSGALIGPLLAVALMLLFADHFRQVFWFAAIPGFASVLLLLWFVHEPVPLEKSPLNPLCRKNIARLDFHYWWVVGVGAIFTLARFSEAFLLLRAQQGGIPIALVPLVLALMNFIYAFSAFPFGKLSDHMSHSKLLGMGMTVLIFSDLVFSIDDRWPVVIVGVVLWGIHMGITQGLLARMIADTAPAELRGTAYGIFNLICGIAMLISSVVAGLLWDQLGPSFTFYAGAVFSFLALVGLIFSTRIATTSDV